MKTDTLKSILNDTIHAFVQLVYLFSNPALVTPFKLFDPTQVKCLNSAHCCYQNLLSPHKCVLEFILFSCCKYFKEEQFINIVRFQFLVNYNNPDKEKSNFMQVLHQTEHYKSLNNDIFHHLKNIETYRHRYTCNVPKS